MWISMPRQLVREVFPSVTVGDGPEAEVEWTTLEDVDSGKLLSIWTPGAPIMCNVVKDEDYHPHATHLRLVAALLPHKEA